MNDGEARQQAGFRNVRMGDPSSPGNTRRQDAGTRHRALKSPISLSLLLQVLVEIGLRGPRPELLDAVPDRNEMLHSGWRNQTKWEPLVQGMNGDRLFALLRGAIVASEHFRWIGGSVAIEIWLKHILLQRNPELRRAAVKWVRVNSTNHYLTDNDDPQDYLDPEEYRLYDAQRRVYFEEERVWVAAHKKAQAEREAKAVLRRQEHAKGLREKAARWAERNAHRKASLTNFAELDPIVRLRRVLQDESVTLAWYPPEWGVLSDQDMRLLDDQDLVKVLHLTARKSSRSWRSTRPLFHRELAGRSQ